jgi:hypothetical protein
MGILSVYNSALKTPMVVVKVAVDMMVALIVVVYKCPTEVKRSRTATAEVGSFVSRGGKKDSLVLYPVYVQYQYMLPAKKLEGWRRVFSFNRFSTSKKLKLP